MRLDDCVLDATPAEGARRVVLGLLDEAVEAAADLAAGAGDEPLHDFRVAVRRLRSALATFRPWLADAAHRREARRLKKVARATNPARDAEVQLAWLAARRAELSAPAHLPGHAAAVAWFEARRGAGPAPAKLARRLRRAARKLRRRLDRADAARDAGSAGAATFAAALAALATEHAGVLADRIAAIGDATDVEGAHRARIQGKRLRYLLEPLRGSRRADAREAVRALKQLQDLLGELHDAHVLAAELGDALADAAAARARRVHEAVLSTSASAPLADGGHAPRPGRGGATPREALRESPRPGLLALLRLVRERRDALHASLRRAFRDGTVEALAAAIHRLGRALEGEAPAPAPRPRSASPGRPLRARPRPTARRVARR